MSTHLVEDVQFGCDTVMVMKEGSVVFDGDLAELEAIGRAYRGPAGDVTLAEAGYVELMRKS